MNVTEANATFTVLHALGAHPLDDRRPSAGQIAGALTVLANRAGKALQIKVPLHELDTAIDTLNTTAEGRNP